MKVVDVLPWVPSGARRFVTTDRERDLVEHRRERPLGITVGIRDVGVTTDLLRGRPGTALRTILDWALTLYARDRVARFED